MIKRFLASGRTGFYVAVSREGEVGAGDPIQREANGESELTIADIVNDKKPETMANCAFTASPIGTPSFARVA